MKEYKKKQIIKHALQYYIQRPGATEKDINIEKRLLAEIIQDVESLNDQYDIKSPNISDAAGINHRFIGNSIDHISVFPAPVQN